MPYEIDLDAELIAAKALYMAAKLGMKHICANCRCEIYKTRFQGWLHTDRNSLPCWNDMTDGYAEPMNQYDLADYAEAIENETI